MAHRVSTELIDRQGSELQRIEYTPGRSAELAEELEAGGYDSVRSRLGIAKPTSERARTPADFFTDTPFDV